MTRSALFTPWATIVCVPCHNAEADRPGSRSKRVAGDAAADRAEEPNATCDTCGAAVVCTRSDAALCQRFAKAAGFDLWQTGGMCVAAGYARDGWELLATEDEYEPAGRILLGAYREAETDEVAYSEAGDFDEMVRKARYLRALIERGA